MSTSHQRVAKAAGIVMLAIFVSRVLGFIRERAVAEVFGLVEAADVFFAAFAIPDLMYQLLVGGALSSAFIPVFTQYLARDEEAEAWRVVSTFINLTVLLLLGFTIVGVLFTPVLAPLVGVGFSGTQRELLVLLMRITFPAVFFTALSGLSMGVLNSYKQFTIPALGPIFYNLSQILGAYVLGPVIGIVGIAAGTVMGSFGSFGLQLPAVLRKAAGQYRFAIDLTHPGIRQMGRLMLPALVGLSISQINLIIGQNLASLLETGSIVALRLANRLIHFPLGVFAMGISTALFPSLSYAVAKGEMDSFKQAFSLGFRTVMYVTLPSAAGMAALRFPIVRLLFESGEFTSADTAATAYALLFYSLGLFALSGLQILTRTFYSLQDTVTPVKVGLLTVVVNFLLSLAFLRWTTLGHGGLALAFSLTSSVNVFVFLLLLKRKLGSIDGHRILASFVRSVGAATIMAGIVHLSAGYWEQELGNVLLRGRVLQVFGPMLIGAVSYGLLTLVFRMEEPRFLLGMVQQRLQRRSRTTEGE